MVGMVEDMKRWWVWGGGGTCAVGEYGKGMVGMMPFALADVHELFKRLSFTLITASYLFQVENISNLCGRIA